MGQLPVPLRKVLEPEAKRTLRQKTYSFMVTKAILAHSASVERPVAQKVELVHVSWCPL